MICRNEDWQVGYRREIQLKQEQDFSWGKNDCALFACDVIEAMTGADPARWFRGKYDTEQGATKSLLKSPFYNGDSETFNDVFKCVVRELASDHGMDQKDENDLHRGDLVLAKQNDQYKMGICIGRGVACPERETGFVVLSKLHVDQGWEVPY